MSPFALRLMKASNAAEDGLSGIQQLAHDANLLFYSTEEAAEGREAFKAKAAAPSSRSSPSGPDVRAAAGERHTGFGQASARTGGMRRAMKPPCRIGSRASGFDRLECHDRAVCDAHMCRDAVVIPRLRLST